MAAKSSVYNCRAVRAHWCEGCLCNPASTPVYIGMKMQSVIVPFLGIFPRRICSVSGMQGARHAPQIIECKDEPCLCVTSGQIKVSLT